MFTQKLLAAVSLSLLIGCSSFGGDELNADQSRVATDQSALVTPFIYDWDEVMVVDLDIECVTAPCPQYMVFDRLGFRAMVASLTTGYGPLPVDAVPAEGLVVTGDFVPGAWYPGGPGNVLHIDQTVGEPLEFLPYLDKGPNSVVYNHGVNLLSAEHVDDWAYSMNLDMLRVDAETEDLVREYLYKGRLVVNGWLTYNWWGAPPQLFVTNVRTATQDYTVRDTGIECFTEPCPYWAVRDHEGVVVAEVASIDFHVMGVADADTEKLRAELDEGYAFRGVVFDGDWGPDGTGAVLYITENPRDLEPEPEPEPEWEP